ncbi:MAG: tryptophan synthase subunit alpha [Phycisphaerae bacterium]|nr:tryptophan synthase subunit alpha [Phycisphaerae bacterium]
MNKLQATFQQLQATGRKALLPYVTGGYPDPETTVEILKRIDPRRCACVEVGIPFSDPIADGPVIQTSFSAALEKGFQLDALFAAIRQNRQDIDVPLLAMVSYSIVYRRTPRQFVETAKAAGFDGLIVPDLAFEEAEDLATIAREIECPLVLMVAPTSEEQRRRRIAALSEPFIYYQSLAGVTGERDKLPADLADHVRELREETGKPICVGFGIATPAHVAAVCEVADGAIVGSAIVRRMNEAVERGESPASIARTVTDFIAELTAALP